MFLVCTYINESMFLSWTFSVVSQPEVIKLRFGAEKKQKRMRETCNHIILFSGRSRFNHHEAVISVNILNITTISSLLSVFF